MDFRSLTTEEVTNVINDFQNWKLPGMDGPQNFEPKMLKCTHSKRDILIYEENPYGMVTFLNL